MPEIIKDRQTWTMTIPLNDREFTHYLIKIGYDKGTNYGYNDTPRGYYLFTSPVCVEQHGTMSIISGNPHKSHRYLWEQTSKFNIKDMERIGNELFMDAAYINMLMVRDGLIKKE